MKERDVTRATAPKPSSHKFTADRSDMAHRIKREMTQKKEPTSGR